MIGPKRLEGYDKIVIAFSDGKKPWVARVGVEVCSSWGEGTIIGYDGQPGSRATRLLVEITKPSRELPSWGPKLAFFKSELTKKERVKPDAV